MPHIIIYTTMICPYCSRARHLLQRKGVDFEEISVDRDREQMAIMRRRSRRHTVPQIFIDDRHIGGYDDLAMLDARGELDPLLVPVDAQRVDSHGADADPRATDE